MGQINVIISINTDALLKDFPKGGEIKSPEKYVVIQDDEAFDSDDSTHAEITTYIYPGAMILWTIKSLSLKHQVQFTNVEFSPGILIEPPTLFYNQRKCIGVFNMNIEKKKQGYYVEFYLDGDARKTWFWDPYVEPHEPKPHT